MVIGTQTQRRRLGENAWLRRAGQTEFYPHLGLWLALFGLFSLNMAWVFIDPRLSLSPRTLAKLAVVFFGTALAQAYRQWRDVKRDRHLDALFRMLMLALFAGFLTQQVNLFSHLAMTLGRPLADSSLAAWDSAIGFDWNDYARVVASQRWSRAVLFIAYSLLIGPALGIILGVAVWRGRHDRVDELAFLALASGFICVAIAGLLPAISAWNSIATPGVRALVGPQPQAWLAQVMALRGSNPVSLDFGTMEGIATFPSFHTCLALIILWCSRGSWVGFLPGCGVGLAILAATPVYGGHYGVDVMGGAAVMAGLILLWRRIAPGPPPGQARP
ncbi:phosphatase PAP2 family protein [Aestuariivirga sp.]|uniref:phosphatase PAP2 family protein n=1 Tax=Aestuariivirga sp. TaxID=2650926 RepID=UPI0035AD7B96